MCLHIAQHKVSRRLAASLHCLVIGWELSGGDSLRCWCIYLLSADRKRFLCPDWLSFITDASIALFKPVRLGRVCLLTRWDVHEDEKKTFPNLGWHWPLGKQSCSRMHCKCVDVEMHLLRDSVCRKDMHRFWGDTLYCSQNVFEYSYVNSIILDGPQENTQSTLNKCIRLSQWIQSKAWFVCLLHLQRSQVSTWPKWHYTIRHGPLGFTCPCTSYIFQPCKEN